MGVCYSVRIEENKKNSLEIMMSNNMSMFKIFTPPQSPSVFESSSPDAIAVGGFFGAQTGSQSPQEKWEAAQNKDWKPIQTKFGSAPRGRARQPKPTYKGKQELAADLLSKYTRGTNGPARPTKSSSGSPRDLNDKFGRNSLKEKPHARGRFAFVNSRPAGSRPNSGIASWRSATDKAQAWE